MQYEKTEEHALIRESIKRYLDNEVAPLVSEFDDQGIFPEKIFRDLMEMGYLSTMLPEEYGGGGRDLWATVIISEELSKCCAGLNTSAFGHIFCQHWIDMFGTKEQKDNYLPRLSNGEFIGAIALTEPGAGSNITGIKTRATETDDHYVLNGNKIFITNGNVADIICVVAVTDPDSRPKGISTLIFETDTPGFHAGKPMKKLNDPKQKHLEYEACEEHGVFMDAGEFTDYKHETLLDIFRDVVASLKRRM